MTEPQPTLKLYTPQYGYFETRLKAVPVPGCMVALWMIGFEERPEQSAEICICEIFVSDVGRSASKVGYGIHPFGDPSITDDFHRDSLELDAAAYHIYAAEWRPDQVEFFIDNVSDNASLGTLPQSPRYPMQCMLGTYEIPDQLKPGSHEGPWPKTMEEVISSNSGVSGKRVLGGIIIIGCAKPKCLAQRILLRPLGRSPAPGRVGSCRVRRLESPCRSTPSIAVSTL